MCLSLDEAADELLENEKANPREVDVDEAIEVLQKSHEAGLVHMAYTMKGEKKPGIVCSCCPCCCHTLGALLETEYTLKSLLPSTSPHMTTASV